MDMVAWILPVMQVLAVVFLAFFGIRFLIGRPGLGSGKAYILLAFAMLFSGTGESGDDAGE